MKWREARGETETDREGDYFRIEITECVLPAVSNYRHMQTTHYLRAHVRFLHANKARTIPLSCLQTQNIGVYVQYNCFVLAESTLETTGIDWVSVRSHCGTLMKTSSIMYY